MPVIGTGIDLVYVPGFAEQWRQPGTRFEQLFTSRERADCRGGVDDQGIASLAARWAAKEAFIKAWSESLWGSGPAMPHEIHHLIETIRDAWGRPRLCLGADIRAHLAGGEVFVSLSHDGDYALANVLLSRD